MKFPLFVITILISYTAMAQNSRQKTLNEMKPMKTYFLVFLKKGPDRTQDSASADRLQQEHLLYLTRMYNEGHADIMGPLADDGEIRGIVVYNTASEEEARTLAEADPAVVARRLAVEVHPWYTFKGAVLR